MTFVVRTAGMSVQGAHLVDVLGRSPAELDHLGQVVPGVELGWSPFAPRRWSQIRFTGTDLAAEALVALLGGSGARACLAAARDTEVRGEGAFRVAGIRACDPAWSRLAAADFLDRWLYLPLDQALVDAERAAARWAVARALPAGSALHRPLVDSALRQARQASPGTVAYLDRLRMDPLQPPPQLLEALRQLAVLYRELGELVGEFDLALAAVPRAWRRLIEAGRVGRAVALRADALDQGPAVHGDDRVSFVDPRQLPARLVRLGGEPSSAEIGLTEQIAGVQVRLRLSGFRPNGPIPSGESRLLARLIHRRTGTVLSHALLNPPVDRSACAPVAHGRQLEGVLALLGSQLTEVRADVYDAFSEVPPARSDRDQGLHRARRAVHFLRGWRALVAEVRLGSGTARPAARLAHLTRSLRIPIHDAQKPDQPLWRRGPAPSVLAGLGALGDAGLTAVILGRRSAQGRAGRLLAGTDGAGRLLAAEFAAAHEAHRPVG